MRLDKFSPSWPKLPGIRSLFIVITLFVCLSAVSQTHAVDTPPSLPRDYTLGVFPFLAKPTLEGIFAPIAAELAGALGRPVRLQSASGFEKFTENLEGQQYDIAHIHPFEYVISGKKSGYAPLVVRTEKLKQYLQSRKRALSKEPVI